MNEHSSCPLSNKVKNIKNIVDEEPTEELNTVREFSHKGTDTLPRVNLVIKRIKQSFESTLTL